MEENKKLTAVEWLIENLKAIYPDIEDYKLTIGLSKDMEKEQHGDTWDKAIQAHEDRGHVFARSSCDFDDHYNETYGTK
jgi:hypothetical protein